MNVLSTVRHLMTGSFYLLQTFLLCAVVPVCGPKEQADAGLKLAKPLSVTAQHTPAHQEAAESGKLDAAEAALLTQSHEEVVAISPDGRKLLTVLDGEVTRLWSLDTGRRIATLKCDADGVLAGAFSPDGRSLVTAGKGEAVLWSASSGRRLGIVRIRKEGPTAFAFSPNGKMLAIATASNTLRIHDTSSWKMLAIYPGSFPQDKSQGRGYVAEVAFSPDSRLIASVDQTIVSGARTLFLSTIIVRDVKSSRKRTVIPDLDLANALVFAPDSRHIAFSANEGVGVSPYVAVFNLASRKTALTLRPQGEFPGSIQSLVFDSKGERIAAVSGPITIWSLANGKVLRQLDDKSKRKEHRRVFQQTSETSVILFRRGSKLFAAGIAKNRARRWTILG